MAMFADPPCKYVLRTFSSPQHPLGLLQGQFAHSYLHVIGNDMRDDSFVMQQMMQQSAFYQYL